MTMNLLNEMQVCWYKQCQWHNVAKTAHWWNVSPARSNQNLGRSLREIGWGDPAKNHNITTIKACCSSLATLPCVLLNKEGTLWQQPRTDSGLIWEAILSLDLEAHLLFPEWSGNPTFVLQHLLPLPKIWSATFSIVLNKDRRVFGLFPLFWQI